MNYNVNEEMDRFNDEIFEKAHEIVFLANKIKATPSNAGSLQAHSMALDTIIESLRKRLEEEK